MHASCHAVVVAKPWGRGFQPRACAWGGVLTKVKEGFDLLPQHLGLLGHGSRHGHELQVADGQDGPFHYGPKRLLF